MFFACLIICCSFSGSALVRSQYEPAVGKEVTPHQLLSNRRKRRRVDEEPTRLSTDKISIETINISHLEWKPKARHPRWEDIWNYCHHCRCPYVPTSALELLRHLERGHQKLVNVNSLVIPKKTRLEKVDCNECILNAAELLGNKLISRFYIPLTVNIFDSSSNISPYTCFVCGLVNKSQRLLENHFQRLVQCFFYFTVASLHPFYHIVVVSMIINWIFIHIELTHF